MDEEYLFQHHGICLSENNVYLNGHKLPIEKQTKNVLVATTNKRRFKFVKGILKSIERIKEIQD